MLRTAPAPVFIFAALAALALSACDPGPPASDARALYLQLMKFSLTDLIYENDPEGREKRLAGADWPSRAYTMTGMQRLDNLQAAVEDVIAKDVPGDFLEAGAWRGGSCILARAVLRAHGDTERSVWVADSFEGLPPPDAANYPADKGIHLEDNEYLAVSVETVQRNFARYGLLDEQVKFLKGWFKDTFPTAPIERLSVLRLDGDLYESTMDTLVHLYPKVSSGGWIIVDDYGAVPAAAKAVHDYRDQHGITEPIVEIDWTGVYWIKQ